MIKNFIVTTFTTMMCLCTATSAFATTSEVQAELTEAQGLTDVVSNLAVNEAGGQVDAKSKLQTGVVYWDEIYTCPGHSCGEDCIWYHYHGTEEYSTPLPGTETVRVGPYNLICSYPGPLREKQAIDDAKSKLQTGIVYWEEIYTCPGHSCGEDCIWYHYRGKEEYSTSLSGTGTVRVGPYNLICSYPGPLREKQAIDDANRKINYK